MSLIPTDLRYAASHEWLKLLPDGSAVVGITDYAQSSLGDITFVQLPKPGTTLKAGEAFGVIESVKAASDVYCPVAGTVVSYNIALESAPETLNASPFEKGWLITLHPMPGEKQPVLLSAAEYQQHIG